MFATSSTGASRGIASALFTGALLRISGAALNFLAVPIAIRTLGQEKYAAFATLLGFAGWLTIGSLGFGSVAAMSVAATKTNSAEQNDVFWRIVASNCVSVGVTSILFWVSFEYVEKMLVFGNNKLLEAEFRLAGYYCLFAFTLSALGSAFEGRYIGMLQSNYVNSVRFIGQLLAILSLLLLTKMTNNVFIFCFAMTLGPMSSSLWFIVRGLVDWPPPKSFRCDPRESLPLFQRGSSFLASSLAVVFFGGGGLPLFAASFGTAELPTAGVMARIIQLYFGLTFILTSPLGAALRRALADREFAWVRRALLLSLASIVGAAACGAFVFIFWGEFLITEWSGTQLPSLATWLVPIGVMVAVINWYQFWIYVASAVVGPVPVAKTALMEVAVVSISYYSFGHFISPSASLLIIAATMMGFSGTILPICVVLALSRQNAVTWRACLRGERRRGRSGMLAKRSGRL